MEIQLIVAFENNIITLSWKTNSTHSSFSGSYLKQWAEEVNKVISFQLDSHETSQRGGYEI